MFRPWLLTIFKDLVSFLACAAYGSNNMVGILHVIKINIVKFKCYNS